LSVLLRSKLGGGVGAIREQVVEACHVDGKLSPLLPLDPHRFEDTIIPVIVVLGVWSQATVDDADVAHELEERVVIDGVGEGTAWLSWQKRYIEAFPSSIDDQVHAIHERYDPYLSPAAVRAVSIVFKPDLEFVEGVGISELEIHVMMIERRRVDGGSRCSIREGAQHVCLWGIAPGMFHAETIPEGDAVRSLHVTFTATNAGVGHVSHLRGRVNDDLGLVARRSCCTGFLEIPTWFRLEIDAAIGGTA